MIQKGDYLNIKVNGKFVPKSDGSGKPQWFIALDDGDGTKAVNLKPFNGETARHTAKTVNLGSFRF